MKKRNTGGSSFLKCRDHLEVLIRKCLNKERTVVDTIYQNALITKDVSIISISGGRQCLRITAMMVPSDKEGKRSCW